MTAPSRRSTFSPHPSMGLPPRWNVGDLDPAYTTPHKVLDAVSANQTSDPYNPQARSIALDVLFSKADTKCDLVVTCDDGTGTYETVATFKDVSADNESGLYVGGLIQNITLQGRAVKVAVANYSGTGTVTVSVKRMN